MSKSLGELSTNLFGSIRKNTFLVGNKGKVSIGGSEILEQIVYKDGTIEEQKILAEEWVVNRLNYYANLEPQILFDACLTIRLVDAYENNRDMVECALVVAGDKTIEWYE